jgi:hypothetical protein
MPVYAADFDIGLEEDIPVRYWYKMYDKDGVKERRIIFKYGWNNGRAKAMNQEIKISCGRGKNNLSNYNLFGTKEWSAPDTARTRFFIDLCTDGPISSRFYGPTVEYINDENRGPLLDHQVELTNEWLSKHGKIGAYDMGLGKTLAALWGLQYIKSTHPKAKGLDSLLFWIVCPKDLKQVWRDEIEKWGIDIEPKFITNSQAAIRKALKEATLPPIALVVDRNAWIYTRM